MTATVLLGVAGVMLGGVLGRILARKGVTAPAALQGRQGMAYAVLSGVAAVAALVYFSHRLAWIPVSVVLYAQVAFLPATQFAAAFAIGFILVLEWPGRAERRRVMGMIVGPGVLATAFGYLTYRDQPILDQLVDDRIRDGIVMQTTPYTCAPSSIATLARWLREGDGATERSVAALTRTTRAGTHTLAEVRAMRALDLDPRYARRFTIDSLVAHGGPALLHVDEPIGATTIRHAIALLEIDTAGRRVTVGNPLYGRQVKRFEDLQGYWNGEAVLVGGAWAFLENGGSMTGTRRVPD